MGHRHLGINPGGVMDAFSASVVNVLLGKPGNAPVIESHFPAASFLLEQNVMLAIGGADFSPTLNSEPIPLWHPVIATAGSVLEFKKMVQGARAYIGFREDFDMPVWLNSYSTHLKAGQGGFEGRPLQKNDRIQFSNQFDYTSLISRAAHALPWFADTFWEADTSTDLIYTLPGPEYKMLNDAAREQFENDLFTISNQADRMGYLLKEALPYQSTKEILSSATAFGTVQLLPDGKLIILMADHQVSGGYPRVAQVITAHLSKLAQQKPADVLRFKMVDQQLAEALLVQQQQHIRSLQYACEFKLEQWGLQ